MSVPPARAALWCCVGAGFATLIDQAVIAYTAPAVTAALGASVSDVQWFLSVYSLTFGLGLVPAGRLGDAYGRRGLLLAGLGVFLLGALCSALAPGVAVLIAGRLVQGLGAGFISAQVLGLIQDHFLGPARLRAFSSYFIAGSLAAIVGPVLGGAALVWLPSEVSWRVVLGLPAPFIVAAGWVAWRYLPRDRERGAPRAAGAGVGAGDEPGTGRAADPHPRPAGRTGLDLPGIVLLGALVVLATLPAIDPGLPASFITGLVVVVAVLVAALTWWERRYARRGRLPLFAPPLMRSGGFVAGNLVALLWFGSTLATGTVLTVYLLQELGIPALALAFVLMPGALARITGAKLGPRVFGRLGTGVVTAGIAFEAACFTGLALAAPQFGGWAFAWLVAGVQVLLGLCGGMIEPPVRALTLAHVPAGLAGVAASFLQLTQRLAATFLVALTTGLLATGLAGTAPGGEALRTVLLLCAGVTAAAALASRLRAFRV